MPEKELLSLGKEMLGVYISGHPLDKIRSLIEKQTNITTLDMMKINQEMEEFGESKEYKDGQTVKFAGIISKVNKKFTRKNTTMAFISLEDFYGTAEIIVFDNIYSKASNFLVNDNIILVDGKISLREDEPVKIVASNISELSENSNINGEKIKFNTIKILNINITNLTEQQKTKLKGAIKFFTGDRVNVKLEITDGTEVKPCGGIFLNDKILDVFREIVSDENVKIY